MLFPTGSQPVIALVVLHCDNGKEFRGKKLQNELKRLWPEIKFVHGKPRRPRTQGMVERANKEVKVILQKMLASLRGTIVLKKWNI